MLQRLVDAVVSDVPRAQFAGVTVLERGDLSSAAATDDLVRRLDGWQHELAQGPCVDAAREQRTIMVSDVAQEGRWPNFMSKVADAGVAAILSVQLFSTGQASGALNLYSSTAGPFDDEAHDVAMVLAAPVGLAVTDLRKIENLTIALDSRDLIGQAKGILMERYKTNSQEAFDLLVMASQRTNRKLRDIAEQLTATGELTVPE